MKKIWIGVGLAAALTLAGCGGGEKTEAPKTDASATPAGGGPGVYQCAQDAGEVRGSGRQWQRHSEKCFRMDKIGTSRG